MSEINQIASSNLTDHHTVTNLAVVVLLLIPCVVTLLLLNCLFLGYKLLILSKRSGRRLGQDSEMLLRQRLRGSGQAFSALQTARGFQVSLSDPVLQQHPVTSSRASSPQRPRLDHRIRIMSPDGATGSARAPSSIRATPMVNLPSGSQGHSISKAGWYRSAPVLLQSTDSEPDGGIHLAPPNSPLQSSSYDVLTDVNPDVAVLELSKVDIEMTNLPSCLSAVGSGLDSDFGASAGVSLRILSADSDGLSNGVMTSALEWDYYDPCYVRQNNIPKHQHHRPALHTKHYWV